jgi:4-amino-4-deoxy-L-arabinose transferase-like glycosyltransferase
LLALVFLAALGMRVGHLWGQFTHNPLFSAPIMDEKKHHEWAQSIAAGKALPEPFAGRPFFRAPLYYYLLAGLYKLVGPNVVIARLAGAALGAVTCLLIAVLGTTLAGSRAGVIAGLLAAVYWPFVVFDAQLLTVGLELFLNLLLLILLLHAARGRSRASFFVSGIVLGLAALTRPNTLALAPGIALWLWLGEQFGILKDTVYKVVRGMADALAAGDLTLAAQVLWAGLKLAWEQGTHALLQVWLALKGKFLGIVNDFVYGGQALWVDFVAGVQSLWARLVGFLRSTWAKFSAWHARAVETTANWIAKRWIELQGLFDSTLDVAAAKESVDQQSQQRFDEIAAREQADLTDIEKSKEQALAEAAIATTPARLPDV